MKALGQGRPLGLIWAWLLHPEATHGLSCGHGGIDHSKYFADLPTRLKARADFVSQAGAADMLKEERKPNVGVVDIGPLAEPMDLH